MPQVWSFLILVDNAIRYGLIMAVNNISVVANLLTSLVK